jgi:hypothetical protein
MSCECHEPCERQPYRCQCERDCWVGEPALYEDCIADCNEAGCDFPVVPGLPSRGYRCEDTPEELTECQDDCSSFADTQTGLCLDALSDCLGDAADAEEIAECYASECICRSATERDRQNCRLECDDTITYPAALECAGVEVDEAAACCAVDLSACYEPCEETYLAAATPIEEAYLDCVKGTYEFYGGWFGWDADTGSCNSGVAPDVSHCEGTRIVAMASAERARIICRATCERDEMRAERPEDRKTKECGGRYHLCSQTCDAIFQEDLTPLAAAFYSCKSGCTGEATVELQTACVEACAQTYRGAYALVVVYKGECLLACCKEEYDHARHGHALAECRWPCYATRIAAEVACYTPFAECMADAGDDTARAACRAAWQLCEDAWRSDYDACMLGCRGEHFGDCPDCFDDIVSDLEDDPDVGYNDGGGGLPTSGVGQHP